MDADQLKNNNKTRELTILEREKRGKCCRERKVNRKRDREREWNGIGGNDDLPGVLLSLTATKERENTPAFKLR